MYEYVPFIANLAQIVAFGIGPTDITGSNAIPPAVPIGEDCQQERKILVLFPPFAKGIRDGDNVGIV